MNPIFKSHEKDFMRIEADQVCVDYNGTVALYDASLNLKAGSISVSYTHLTLPTILRV